MGWAADQAASFKIMQRRKKRDDKKAKDFCQKERKEGTVVFPAIQISDEIEDKEDTTCIDTNRDELLKAFCSFRMDFTYAFFLP